MYVLAIGIYLMQSKQGGLISIVANAMMYEAFRENEDDRKAVSRALAFQVAW